MALDESRENEKAVQINGIDVLVDEDARDFAEGSTIDYMDDLYQKGFTIGIGGCSGC
jgi:Fe-S cluster assembly iron-binding protein IscA